MRTANQLLHVITLSAFIAVSPAEAQVINDSHTIIGPKIDQPAGPNREHAIITRIRCADKEGSGRELLIYEYPDRRGPEKARAVVPGNFNIIGNYPDYKAATDNACSNKVALNTDGPWILYNAYHASDCHFRGTLSGYGQSYKFVGEWKGHTDIACHGVFIPPGRITCDIKGPFGNIENANDRAKGVIACTAQFPKGTTNTPGKLWEWKTQTNAMFIVDQGKDWCVVRDPTKLAHASSTSSNNGQWIEVKGDALGRTRKDRQANLSCPDW
jgi:hypothetical protein